MFIKVKLNDQAKDNLSGSYINIDNIIEVYYSIKDKEYIAIVNSPYFDQTKGMIARTTVAYAIEKESYDYIVESYNNIINISKSPKILKE